MKTPNQKISRVSYAITSLSFIPYFGILFAPIVIVWGMVKGGRRGQIIAFIGMAGLFSSWLFGLGVNHFYSIRQENFHNDKHLKYTISELPESIESFKRSEGSYPTSLEVFRRGTDIRLHNDTIDRLYYKVTEDGDKYVLLGVGADNKPFTVDDILPTVEQSSSE